MKTARPRQYWDDYASRFKNRSLAETYELRPPYPDETYKILLSLLGESPGRILDVGCGPGKIARALVDHVNGIDAVDFSEEMIRVGKSLVNGDHPNLRWIVGPVEDSAAVSTLQYGDGWCQYSLDGVGCGFSEIQGSMLTTDGYLVIIDGDCPVGSPWHDAELSLIHKYSTNRHHERIDLIQELVNRGHLHLIGDKKTTPVSFSQSLTDYVQSFHSRESMSKEHMGEENVRAFDAELSDILSDFVDDDRCLSFQLQVRVTWGKPLT